MKVYKLYVKYNNSGYMLQKVSTDPSELISFIKANLILGNNIRIDIE